MVKGKAKNDSDTKNRLLTKFPQNFPLYKILKYVKIYKKNIKTISVIYAGKVEFPLQTTLIV